MEEILGWILLVVVGGAIAVTLLFFLIWILVALLARIFSLIVLYWAVTFLLAMLAGLITGIVLPARVLTGRGRQPFWQLRPADVVAGTAIPGKPAGPNRGYGWDDAWPNYLPYQALQDVRAVAGEARLHVGSFWGWLRSKARRPAATSTGTAAPSARTRITRALGSGVRGFPRFLWHLVILPVFLGYALAVWVSILGWIAVMAVIGALIAALQQIVLSVYRLFDILTRRRNRASLKCPHCFGESTLPGYHCSGEGCDVIHWTMLPGPLGLFTRRCSCGTQLPNTVRGAAARLAPVCPYCRQDMALGAGLRQTVQIPVVGSIGAGKSRLLEAAAIEFAEAISTAGGSLNALDDSGERFIATAWDHVSTQAITPKTPDGKAVGIPLEVRHGDLVVEVQILDVAGEAFATWETTANLRYLDNADVILFVLDPLGIPDVAEQFQRSSLARSVLVATGDQEESYGAAVDRMRAENVPLDRRSLGVVVTKGDVLLQLPIGRTMAGRDSADVRAWLVSVGADLLAQRFEKDFGDVRYFVVDSMTPRATQDPMNPWWVLDWVFTSSGTPLRPAEALQARTTELSGGTR